jgi:hypothetical protein
VAHFCNPRYSGGRDGEDLSLRPVLEETLARPHLQQAGQGGLHLGSQLCSYVCRQADSKVEAKTGAHTWNICKSKKGLNGSEGMIQVVECLPSNCKALSSNPSTANKSKNVISALHFTYLFFSSTGDWTQGLHLEPLHSNCLPRMAMNCNPPDLCLLSSFNYRHGPPAPSNFILKITLKDWGHGSSGRILF